MPNHLLRRSFLTSTAGLAGSAALAASGLLPGRALAADPVNIGFVYVGPTGDNGWTHRHNVGRLAIEEALGDAVTTRFVENVSEGPDAERVIRQLASTGSDLIFTTSFGFMNPTIKVARQFPDVKFEHATGYKTADNVAVYNARFYEGRAVIGTIAGMMSESGVAGYIGSFPIPEVVMGINAFTLAARKINPEFRTIVVWVNTWHDPAKEAEAARTLFDQGADIISQHTDSAAPLQVAEERGLYGFGQAADQSAFAPEGQLTAIIDNWNPYYIERARAVAEGTWESHSIWWGLSEGMVEMAPYGPAVPEDVRAAAEEVRKGIIAGDIHPFTGPIEDQKGEVRVPEGETASDKMLLSMDWYVPGVRA